METEYLDLVDEGNRLTGEIKPRSEAHANSYIHRTVHIYLFRVIDELEFLANLRAETKDLHPGKWDRVFGGHVKAGETVSEAIVSEAKEELNLDIDLHKVIRGNTIRNQDGSNNEFCYVRFYEFSGDLSELEFADGEVQAIRWLTVDEIIKESQANPQLWVPDINKFDEALSFLKTRISSGL